MMTASGDTKNIVLNAQTLDNAMALLARTPAVLDALLRDLPEFWTRRNEGENTWNAFDVVGHLIHSERTNWMARVTLILKVGEAEPFETFDRWGQQQGAQDQPLDELLDEFRVLRAHSLDELRAMKLAPKQFELCGKHPTFGKVTLSELLATWTAHDLTHLHQLSRIMAHQYRQEVGPWRKFLGVMQCDGHSS